MTVYQDEPSKQLHRELVIHTYDKHLYDVTVDFLTNKTNLQLKPSDQVKNIRICFVAYFFFLV